MLAATPELARYIFATAVILGDAGRVRTELSRDPGLATQADTRTGWTPLHAARASRWRRLDPAWAEGLLAVARMLLDVGADPNGRTGEEYGVARLTANKALRLLVTEGLAVLSPGMASTCGRTSARTDGVAGPDNAETPHQPELAGVRHAWGSAGNCLSRRGTAGEQLCLVVVPPGPVLSRVVPA
jgi:hypothetical protein